MILDILIRKKQGVIQIRLDEKSKKLNSIYDIIKYEMSALGFFKEKRSFKPHITLGRKVLLEKSFEEIKYLQIKR